MNEIELMSGFPPDVAGQVTLANWRRAPFNKWSFTHLRELIASAAIANDPGSVAELPAGAGDLGGMAFEFDGSRYDLERFLAETETDGMLVLREGADRPRALRAGHGRSDPPLLRVRHEVGAGARRGGPRRTRDPRRRAARDGLDSGGLGNGVGRRDPARPSRHAGRHPVSTRTISRPRARSSSTRKAQGWDPLAPGETPSDLRLLLPDPDRLGRHARRGLPLRLAQHRPPRVGHRASHRETLSRPRERAHLATDGRDRRRVHHRRPPRGAPGRRRDVRNAP